MGADSKKCHVFYHEEHEGLEGITILTYFMCFIEIMSKTKLFNPYFSSLTSCSSW